MRQDIKTSVIIPVYNTKNYLEECIKSVLAQTQEEIEIILVDDGSTDGSTEIIKYYERNYSCVRAVYQKNQKLGAARNNGVKVASGKYIYFLDSDDYISMDLLEKCYVVSEAEKLDFLMIDSETVIEGDLKEFREGSANENYDRSNLGIEKRVYSGTEYWDRFFVRGGVFSNAYLVYINTSFLRNYALYFETGIFYEDMDWIVRLYSCAKRTAYLPKKLYFRRMHPGSIVTVHYNVIHLKSAMMVCKKLIQMLFEEKKLYDQNRIMPILESMWARAKDILKFYSQERCLPDIWLEVAAFYRYLIHIYKNTVIDNTWFRVRLLIMAETIEPLFDTLYIFPWETEKCKKQFVTDQMKAFDLDNPEKSVGIYGLGMRCERFFKTYQKYLGAFSAKLFFLDTYQESGHMYQGYPVYNIKDAGKPHLDTVIVTSSRYRDEMMENIYLYGLSDAKILFIEPFTNALF